LWVCIVTNLLVHHPLESLLQCQTVTEDFLNKSSDFLQFARRQNYAKNAARPRGAIQFNTPALTLDGPASDGQAQARAAALLARTGLVDTVEPLEHFVSVLRAMPGPRRPPRPENSWWHYDGKKVDEQIPVQASDLDKVQLYVGHSIICTAWFYFSDSSRLLFVEPIKCRSQ
jgi:hypothetical protein